MQVSKVGRDDVTLVQRTVATFEQRRDEVRQ